MLHTIYAYETYLRDVRNASKNTLASYMRDLKLFGCFLEEINGGDLIAVTHQHIISYLDKLKSDGKSPATVTRTTAGLRSFYSYLHNQDIIERNPTLFIKNEKSERKAPQILSSQEVDSLLKQPNCVDPKGYRDRAMLELLYATGIRVSELISLNITDVIMNSEYIKCINGKSDRMVPLYPSAARALKNYTRGPREKMLRNNSETALFVNCNGERMTRQGFWKIIKLYQERANIKRDITPQMLRHTFATHLLENGADLQSIQMMMGHADISSTQVYADLIKRKIGDVYHKAHPRATADAS